MKSVRRILVPIDFSKQSNQALAWAGDLAVRYDASITILHVYQTLELLLPEGYVLPSASSVADLLRHAGSALDHAKHRLELSAPGIAVKTELRHGVPFVEIVRLAREGDFDLIVIGTHGRTGIQHALLGSVAEKVVRKAPCPVLAARMTDHPAFAPP